MALSTTLPNQTNPSLSEEHASNDQPAIMVLADLTLNGSIGTERLLIRDGRLLVYGADQELPRHDLPLEVIDGANAESLVGGGALLATIGGAPVELARYTNAQGRSFSRVAKYLDDLARYREALALGGSPTVPRFAIEADGLYHKDSKTVSL